MANLGILNKNPGNLKDPSTGQFKVFNTPEEGHQALINDITLKQSGKSSHIKPGASIDQLASVWAPASDNNIPKYWATNVAKYVGVPTTYAFDKVPAEKLAEGIKVAEGTSGGNTGDHSSVGHSRLAQKIRAKYPTEYNDLSDAELERKVLSKYPQYADLGSSNSNQSSNDGYARNPEMVQSTVPESTPDKPGIFQGLLQGVAHPFLEAGASIGSIGNHSIAAVDHLLGRDKQGDIRASMGDKIDSEGADYGYFGKAKPLGAGFDINKSASENAAPLLNAAKSGAEIGSDIAAVQGLGGLAKGLFTKSSVFSSPVVKGALEKYIPEVGTKGLAELMSGSSSLSASETINALTQAQAGAGPVERSILEKAIEELTPTAMKELGGPVAFSEAHPILSGTGGLLGKLLKGGAVAVGGGLIGAGLGGNAKSLYSKIIH